ncbi:MAG: substrate-binding domain-containing protein [Actinomycetota bacterium]|nr:substrate-binding domain-containing protein [Actinomycetota bacterium]
MRKSATSLVAVGVAAAVVISGCSSSKKSGTTSTTGSSSTASGKPQVGVILPDTTTSNRYTLYDQPLLQKAFDAAGIKSTIQNAHGSNSTFVSDAQTMITEGVKVLLIDPADPATGISVEKLASAAGVQVIDYDRVNLGGSAKYYVSFDNEKVGELQGQGLVDCLNAKKVKTPSIITLNGGTDIDNNAVLFKSGAHKILDPLFQNGTLKKGPETDVKGWDNTVAATDFQQSFTQDPTVGGVLAANDGIAAAAISTLKQHHLQIPVTGQDATIQGIQYILTGDQCLTIFKDVSKEADAASKLAIDLIKGDTASAASLASGTLHDPTGNRDIPSVLLTPEVITKATVKDVISAGALTSAQICAGIQAACTAAGISS